MTSQTVTPVKREILNPRAIILYVRQSDARDDEKQGGIAHHITLLQAEAKRRGWGVLKVIVENDVPDGKGGTKRKKSASAFKRRKVTLPDGRVVYRVIRLGFAEAMRAMESGESDGMLMVAADRAMRDPRDLEDMIDVVRRHSLNIGTISGTLRFTNGGTDEEIDFARFAIMIANRESRIKADRQRGYRERDAHKAKGNGGCRPYGWELDYKTADHVEKLVIETASKRFLQGISLKAIAAELNDAQVPTVNGGPWSAETLAGILKRPRNAGLVVYDKEIQDGLRGEWEALIPVDLYMAVREKLIDPSRKSQAGRPERWMGSGVYLCGACNDGTSVSVTIGGREPRYKCTRYNHLARNVAHTDAMVEEWLVDRCGKADIIGLFIEKGPDIDVAALRDQRNVIATRLQQMAADVIDGLCSRADLLAARERATVRFNEIDAQLAKAVAGDSLVSGLIMAEDIRATWRAYPVATKRAILRTLARVELKPIAKRQIGFNPDSVRITQRVAGIGTVPAQLTAVA